MKYALFLALCAGLVGCSSFTITESTWTAPDGFKVLATEYAQNSQASGTTDSVILLPPTGGSTILERRYAAHLCERGQRVIIVQTWTGLEKETVDLETHDRLFTSANRAVGMALERATGEVKIMGTSLGALYSLSAVARYPRIRRAVLIVGGYPFTEVIARSNYPTMKALREKRREAYGIADFETYKRRLDDVFTWNDPQTIRSPELDRVDILLVQGLTDEAVPTVTQKNLETLLPKARVIKINAGHLWTIVSTYLFHEGEVLDLLAH